MSNAFRIRSQRDAAFSVMMLMSLAAPWSAHAQSAALEPRIATEMVQRALPFLTKEGADWIEERECVSCHQVPTMLWTLNGAARVRLDVDRKQLGEWSEWSRDWRVWTTAGAKNTEAKSAGDNVDTINFLLLGRDTAEASTAPWLATFRRYLLESQRPDGSWKAGGQFPLTKRPVRESDEVTTMWTLLALLYTTPDQPPKPAAEWLAAAKPGVSTEWHAVRLVLYHASGEKDKSAGALAELLKRQHPDGGWGWLSEAPSDALGTGIALYALARAGLPFTHESVQRAIGHLSNTQRPDGSWPVPSTRTRDKNKLHPTSIYWGTAWASVGLLEWLAPPYQPVE